MSDKPSIAELQRETSRWPTDWKPAIGEEGDWDGFWWCKDHNGSGERVATDTCEDYANGLARRIADLANAAPVLLEIAAAALEYEQAQIDAAMIRYAFANADDRTAGARHIEAHDRDEIRCREALRAALAKVRP